MSAGAGRTYRPRHAGVSAQPGGTSSIKPKRDPAWFANDQHVVDRLRAVPALDQHGHFVVVTYKRREIARAGTASAAARPHQPKQSHRLGHALQRVSAALLGDEQAGEIIRHLDEAASRLTSKRGDNRFDFGVVMNRRCDRRDLEWQPRCCTLQIFELAAPGDVIAGRQVDVLLVATACRASAT